MDIQTIATIANLVIKSKTNSVWTLKSAEWSASIDIIRSNGVVFLLDWSAEELTVNNNACGINTEPQFVGYTSLVELFKLRHPENIDTPWSIDNIIVLLKRLELAKFEEITINLTSDKVEILINPCDGKEDEWVGQFVNGVFSVKHVVVGDGVAADEDYNMNDILGWLNNPEVFTA